MNNSSLNVFIATGSGTPSLSPLDSDGIVNAIHVEQVIGTLVRMYPSGRYEGYLAESWKNSEDFKEWTFSLRPGLRCEDGTPINSQTFKKSLIKVIRLIKSHSDMPMIDRIQGFSQVDKGDLPGIQTPDERTLRFVFDKPVTTGFLEYIALPYLGFYCDSDFNSDGSWKDHSKVTSSASYRVDNWSGQGPVTLKRRSDWPLADKRSPEAIVINLQPMEQIKAPKTGGFIISFLLDQKDVPSEYRVVNMLPTIFHGISISDQRNKWLSSADNRRILRDEIKRQQEKYPPSLPSVTAIDRFYPHMSTPVSKKGTLVLNARPNVEVPLEIVTLEKPSIPSKYMQDITMKALDALDVPYTVKVRSQAQKDLMNTYRDPTYYDIRPVSVDAGGGIENQLVKFMFCSKLGVSFLDPSRRICKLVDEYESLYGDVVPQTAVADYIRRFDSIVDEDAAIIPIMKTGHSWLLSPDLDIDSVSPTMNIPYFDLFKARNE